MNDFDTIAVFTARSPARVLAEGGSQAWVMNPTNARPAKWLVATQNAHNPDNDFSDATEPHGSGFLVGKISGIVPCSEDDEKGRWMIQISEFARIEMPKLWKWRNPVKYTTLADLGIKLEDLKFEPMPPLASETTPTTPTETPVKWPPATLSIAEAKRALAATFGVKPEAVEISIRG